MLSGHLDRPGTVGLDPRLMNVQTQRSVVHFAIGSQTMPLAIIRAGHFELNVYYRCNSPASLAEALEARRGVRTQSGDTGFIRRRRRAHSADLRPWNRSPATRHHVRIPYQK
jgi:hypothetical protein